MHHTIRVYATYCIGDVYIATDSVRLQAEIDTSAGERLNDRVANWERDSVLHDDDIDALEWIER